MTALAPHLSAFLRERLPETRGASVHTCDSYAYAFKLLLEFAAKRFRKTPSAIALEAIDAALVLAFLTHIEEKRGCSASTRNARLAAIRSFMRFVELRVPSIIEQSRRVLAIPMKRTDTKLVRHLSQEEIEGLLRAPDVTTREGIRDRAMMHLAFAAGLRATELVTLPLAAVTMTGVPSIRVVGKGRRERALPLWKSAADDIRAWIAVRGDAHAPVLFTNARGVAMTRSGFEYVLAKHVGAATVRCPSLATKSVSPHVLRHTCAMTILRATGDIRKVSLWLGHTDIKTTQMYLRADPEEKLEAITKVAGPSLARGRFRAPDKLIASLMVR
ncbi:MAG: tyrosine-type recombinase/integrase [Polyangiales bacterium]